MQTKNTLPITEARRKIFSIAEEVQTKNNYYTLTEHGVPKVVILSAQRYEKILEQQDGKLILADKSSGKYALPYPGIFSKTLIIRDESRVVYLSGKDQEARRQEEELIKSQLFVELIEKYKYPLSSVELGRYVRLGGESSKRYIEADIIINDEKNNAQIIFEVGTFNDYEKNIDCALADLFSLANAVSYVKKPKWLIYFSRFSRNGVMKEKILSVNCEKFNSFLAWKKAGRPGEKTIVSFKN